MRIILLNFTTISLVFITFRYGLLLVYLIIQHVKTLLFLALRRETAPLRGARRGKWEGGRFAWRLPVPHVLANDASPFNEFRV